MILVLALIVFGPKKLPEIGKSLGRSINEFKRSIASDDSDKKSESETKKQVMTADEATGSAQTHEEK